MSGSEDATSPEDRSERTSERLPAGTWTTPYVQSRDKVRALLESIDEQIQQLRHEVLQALPDDPSADVPIQADQVLEALAIRLQQANEHLVIASLDASAREEKTAESHRKQTLFLSMLAHELRNPLAPIVMGVELLRRMPGTSPAVQHLQGILARQTAHLNRLVEDLLDATRINSGKIRIQKEAVLLSQLLAQAVETSQPVLDAHHQTIELDLPAQPVWVDGDLIRLSQLFSNLLINASKFSADHTAVHIRARLKAAQVLVAIKDEGIGIAPALQPFVFDLFVQGPVGDGQMASGLGIGLSLVQTIAELHGGSVQVMSAGVGTGSEFIVTLPLADRPTPQPDAATEPAPMPRPALAAQPLSRRILLIDDNADINQTLSDFLVEAGHEVQCAEDGATGLRMDQARHHDVVCCDIGMPGMDGYAVARALRKRSPVVRLIAISGYSQAEHRDRALAAGFDHYLIKPVWGPALLDLIDLPGRDASC